MNDDAPHGIALTCHDSTPSRWVHGIRARACFTSQGALQVGFRLEGALARLRVPRAVVPRRGQRLWEHTCFELFVAVRAQAAYREFNFSPSGEWAVYAFQDYREGGPLAQSMAPGIATRNWAEVLELDALVRSEWMPPTSKDTTLQIALSAVVEDDSGGLSYWALRHPPGRPDFHARDAFALELAAPHQSQSDLHRGFR